MRDEERREILMMRQEKTKETSRWDKMKFDKFRDKETRRKAVERRAEKMT